MELNLNYLRTLIRSLNSLLCNPLPLSKRWLNEIDKYLKEVNKEHKIQFPEKEVMRNCTRKENFICPTPIKSCWNCTLPEKEVVRNCTRKENFMCPFVEITTGQCCYCNVPERTIKTYCDRTKTNICPYENISTYGCHQCKIPNSFRDSEINKIIEEIREEREKEMAGVNPLRVCPITRNTVCYDKTKDDSACETCIIKKEKEMPECGEVVKMKCFHVNKSEVFGWTKDNKTCKYEKLKRYWGGVITNKATRTKERYANRITIDGSCMSNINEEDFKKIFAPMCEHIYEDCDDNRPVTFDERKWIHKIVHKLCPDDCESLLDELLKNSRLSERYFIKPVGLDKENWKNERLIILKKK